MGRKITMNGHIGQSVAEVYQDFILAKTAEGVSDITIRKEKIMGESMLQKIRSGQMVSWATLETICDLLNCQPGDIIEYVREDDKGVQ